ncbi:hypothetical protein DPEC_G00375650 [Dallia pectoralis]|nr:hypothetical protein DPEC_G00375650 [Dallia pectoralis]
MLTVSRLVVMSSCFSFSFRSISVSRRPLTTFSSAANVLHFSHPTDGVLGTGLFRRNNLLLVKLQKEEEPDGSAADWDMNPLAGRFGVPRVEEVPDSSAADGADGSAADGAEGSAADGSDGSAADGSDGSAADGSDGSAADGSDGSAADGSDGSAADGSDGSAADGSDGSAADGSGAQRRTGLSGGQGRRLSGGRIVDPGQMLVQPGQWMDSQLWTGQSKGAVKL